MGSIALEVLKPPNVLPERFRVPSVFLGGSIEMGAATDWQSQCERACEDLNVILLNPRRDYWDLTWEQRADSPQFRNQVTWELDALERADLVVFYFAPGTRSPITLLELGLFAGTGKVVVCCPHGFWRKGNVDIVCERFGVPLVPNLETLTELIRDRFSTSTERL